MKDFFFVYIAGNWLLKTCQECAAAGKSQRNDVVAFFENRMPRTGFPEFPGGPRTPAAEPWTLDFCLPEYDFDDYAVKVRMDSVQFGTRLQITFECELYDSGTEIGDMQIFVRGEYLYLDLIVDGNAARLDAPGLKMTILSFGFCSPGEPGYWDWNIASRHRISEQPGHTIFQRETEYADFLFPSLKLSNF